jgi:hypothetical protein
MSVFGLLISSSALRAQDAPIPPAESPAPPPAESIPDSATATPQNGPYLEVDPPIVLFEDLYAGQKGEKTVQIKNIGTELLVIENVKAGCGCTGVMMGEKNIPPGGSSPLQVSFASSDRYVGKKTRKSINIYSNDPRDGGVFRLDLEADVKAGIIVEPSVINLGQIVPGATQTINLKLTSEDGSAFKVEDVTMTGVDLLSEYDKTAEAPLHNIQTQFVPSGAERGGRLNLVVKTTHAKRPEITLPVYWREQRPITVQPAYLALGKIDSGSSVERKITVTSNLKEPMKNVQFRVDGAPIGVTATQDTAKPDDWTLTFSVPQELTGQRIRAQLVMTVDNENVAEIRVHMTAQVSDDINLMPELPG